MSNLDYRISKIPRSSDGLISFKNLFLSVKKHRIIQENPKCLVQVISDVGVELLKHEFSEAEVSQIYRILYPKQKLTCFSLPPSRPKNILDL